MHADWDARFRTAPGPADRPDSIRGKSAPGLGLPRRAARPGHRRMQWLPTRVWDRVHRRSANSRRRTFERNPLPRERGVRSLWRRPQLFRREESYAGPTRGGARRPLGPVDSSATARSLRARFRICCKRQEVVVFPQRRKWSRRSRRPCVTPNGPRYRWAPCHRTEIRRGTAPEQRLSPLGVQRSNLPSSSIYQLRYLRGARQYVQFAPRPSRWR